VFEKLLPERIDDTYRGRGLALWLLGLVASVKVVQTVAIICSPYSTLRDADGIPLESYPPDAVQTIVANWELSALGRLIISLLCILVLARYRSLVSFMLAVLAADYLGRELILYFTPITRVGNPPGPIVNLLLFALTLLGLALSIWKRPNASQSAKAERQSRG